MSSLNRASKARHRGCPPPLQGTGWEPRAEPQWGQKWGCTSLSGTHITQGRVKLEPGPRNPTAPPLGQPCCPAHLCPLPDPGPKQGSILDQGQRTCRLGEPRGTCAHERCAWTMLCSAFFFFSICMFLFCTSRALISRVIQ